LRGFKNSNPLNSSGDCCRVQAVVYKLTNSEFFRFPDRIVNSRSWRVTIGPLLRHSSFKVINISSQNAFIFKNAFNAVYYTLKI
jgi:hypothetical protein